MLEINNDTNLESPTTIFDFIKKPEKLNLLIGINVDRNYVYLYDLENNIDLKTEIGIMITDIKKYYSYGTWGFFSNTKLKGQGNIIGLQYLFKKLF